MDFAALSEMFTVVHYFFIGMAALIGIFVGYLGATFRINRYLKRYYPEVNFQQAPKERVEIIAARKDSAIPEEKETEKTEEKQEKNKK